MKKLLVVLLVIVLGVGGGVGMYALSLHLNNTETVEPQTEETTKKTEKETNKVIISEERGNINVSKYIFLGDSRFYGMEMFAEPEDVFIYEIGEGYHFMMNHLAEAKSHIVDEDSVMIIGMGVNDFRANADNYITAINQLADENVCQIYYMLVNPVDDAIIEQNGYGITNAELDEFNTKMIQGLNDNVKIIDANTYLKTYGYNTEDGLHYDAETYKSIYEYIKVCVTNY
ncbi:MAG: SGNH/GDSL hydrolase family protein [Lachnospiraceae bacterium]|nr:SGNH/GDSL hydrolase family protein [Lachnospiraceae bacterium]MBQ4068077.1 SGNH/GDSL hydrolase family protein [Lachnospiraceae bacterium]